MRQIVHNKRCLLWSPDGASFIICLAGNGSPVQRQISLQSWSSISSTQLWISTILMLLLPWRDALEPVWNTDPIYCTIHQRMLFQWLVLFRPDLSPSNATQHSTRIVQHTKIKIPLKSSNEFKIYHSEVQQYAKLLSKHELTENWNL